MKLVKREFVPEVTRVVTPAVPATIELTLTLEEAAALHDVLRRVGGHPKETHRGLVQAICDELYTVDTPVRGDDITGSITFLGEV